MKYRILSKEEIAFLEPFEKRLSSEELEQLVVSKGFYDVDFFVTFFLGHYKQDKKTEKPIADAPFHKELRAMLQSENDTLVVVPRDHAKSTNSFFVIMHDLCYEKEKEILLVMSKGLGAKTIGKIRNEFETNALIEKCFGRIVPQRTKEEQNKKWNQNALQLLNGTYIETVSMGGRIRGARTTKVIVDDPQEDKEVRNQENNDKFENWFFLTVYNTLDPSGKCVVLGTIIGDDCFVSRLLNNSRGFDVIEYDAVKNPEYQFKDDGTKHLIGGEPLRPEKWSIKNLNDRLQKIGWGLFQQEYMNIPYVRNSVPIFDIDYLSTLQPATPIRKDNRFPGLTIYQEPGQCSFGMDLARGGPQGDYTTIVARDDNFRIVLSYQARIPGHILVEVIDYIDNLGYYGIKGIENNFGVADAVFHLAKGKVRYSDLYKQKALGKVHDKENYDIGWHTSEQSKDKMIDDMITLLAQKKVTDFDPKTLAEMKTFYRDEKGKAGAIPPYHDDLVIADCICCQMVLETKQYQGYDVLENVQL